MAMMDALDQRLLNLLQDGLALVPEPFALVASRLGIDTPELLQRIARLRAEGVIREISAIFDTRSLGYHSTLVAASVPEARLDAAAALVNEHPGVSHNYRRRHAFNLWFTLGLPPDSLLGLEGTVALLGRLIGATSIRLMPTLRVFKIGMKLDMRDPADADANGESPFAAEVYDESRRPAQRLDPADRPLVRELQWDLPTVAEPFAPCAQRLGLSVEALLQQAQRLHRAGHLRRVAAVLHHRTAGFGANGMGVWRVPEDRIEEVGRRLAAFPEVTHCYQRPTYPDWPYSLFTMVHARDQAGCQAIMQALAAAAGLDAYEVLYSDRQYKKVRLRYFTPDIHRWELDHVRTSP